MNNSKWIVHKVGLVNFWYYDEEEFHFLDGRMLLRGANGSGKSVTMQSFIPLLLDGNMRPERLDPFGSRARKMENYLLEEDDDREERTGYLYMEFKRMEAEQYITIGVGMRARKNKKMDSWYFYINDGRRIGKALKLYKDMQNKIPLTKTELRNRIGEGGRVLDTQTEYMECVNRLLLGFETIDEYKEMIELLIQLRTPKLSKDFKPTVINDILSNSLQTLSEDDLRPMSEAIENMDSMKTNLDTLRDSVKAAKQMERVYDQYNRVVLYTKADKYLEAKKTYTKYEKLSEQQEKRLEEAKEALKKEKEHHEQLIQEAEVLKEEQKSLSQNDAVRLKEEEQQIQKEIAGLKNQLEEKHRQEDHKKEALVAEEDKYKKQESENEEIWDTVEELLEDMEASMEDIPFDDTEFFIKDLREQKGADYNFSSHRQLLQAYKEKVENGVAILRQEQIIRSAYDTMLKELDQWKDKRSQAEKEYMQYENQLQEVKSELSEQMYRWEKENLVLHLTETALQNVARKIEAYQYGSDYSEVREIVRSEKNEIEDGIRTREGERKNLLAPVMEELRQVAEDIHQWENKKEPEPEQSEAVVQSRQKLKELQIPYLQFYKTVDFAEQLTSEQAGRLEEALLRMGVLDALIVPAEYRSQVLALDDGLCDTYIFSDLPSIKGNLSELLDVDNQENDILFYQQVHTALAGIGLYNGGEENGASWIDDQGNYRIGVLEGTVTKNYKPRFIGAAARERYKEEKLEELRKKQQELEEEKLNLETSLKELADQKQQLEAEWDNLPKEDDLKLAARELSEKERQLTEINKQIRDKEDGLENKRKELEDIRLQVQDICGKTYLTIRLEVFEEVSATLKEYETQLQTVEIQYHSYGNGLTLLNGCKDNIERIEEDLDNIRYDISRLMSGKKMQEAKLASVQEQLSLTDYNDIKERLDVCVKRLEKLPDERDASVRRVSDLENDIKQTEKEQERTTEALRKAGQLKEQLEIVFSKEYQLAYVDMEWASQGDTAEQAEKVTAMLAGQVGDKTQDELHDKVQESFHVNKGYLAEYHLMLVTVFEELKEEYREIDSRITRLDIKAKYRGATVSFRELLLKLEADVEEQQRLLSDKDRELFEDILANTISKKIRARIQSSKRWVDNMNQLMESMQTSSGLRLSLKWKNKRAEKEEQLDTRALVDLLQKDVEIMREEEVEKMSMHFRSKIAEARKPAEDGSGFQSFHVIMKEILDYRKWFEFQLECQKTGEKKKELTDRVFFTFSGGEKAMAMYVPLFSAVVAKYSSARLDAPKLISLDEAFAGVDEMNIKDMFRLMVEFDFNFMINSQILWGDYETVPSLAIYQLVRPENAKFVTVISYVWNGKMREMVEKIGDELEKTADGGVSPVL